MIFTVYFVIIWILGALFIALGSLGAIFVWTGVFINLALLIFAIIDYQMCIVPPKLEIRRNTGDKLSLGAENPVLISIRNNSNADAKLKIRDEIPLNFTASGNQFDGTVPAGERKEIVYHLSPNERGDHRFGDIYVRSKGPLKLVVRQIRIAADQDIRVYPNLVEAAKYELLIRRGRLAQLGLKPFSQTGHGTDFESLRDYQPDDEYRRIDWKATARKSKLISRNYQLERSQTVFILLDTGRTMCVRTGMPSDEEKLSKLDYAVNASLMLAYAATVSSDDQVGLMTFADRVTCYLPPKKGHTQLFSILRALYNIETTTAESDYSAALRQLSSRRSKRSLVVVFTDLLDPESSSGLITHLGLLAKKHLCLCVTIADPAYLEIIKTQPNNIEMVCRQAVASETLRARENTKAALVSKGISVVEALPNQLSPAVINKYLRMKSTARL